MKLSLIKNSSRFCLDYNRFEEYLELGQLFLKLKTTENLISKKGENVENTKYDIGFAKWVCWVCQDQIEPIF